MPEVLKFSQYFLSPERGDSKDYPRIYKTPNLNSIAATGVKAGRMISSFPTVTFPNHYSIATGLYPDHHGLINNSFPAPDLGFISGREFTIASSLRSSQ